jgi:putative peptide zinc metalloprotease protein
VANGGVDIGSVAPDFELESVQGPLIRLNAYRGTHTVVLWFSRGFTCPFCRRFMTQLGQVYDKFQSAQVEIVQLGPNVLKSARTYFERQPPKFPFVCDPEKQIFARYGLRDIGPIEANKNTLISFAYAYTHGDGLNTTRASALDVFTDDFIGRMRHHAFAAIQQAVFIVDREGIVRDARVLRPIDTMPPSEEILREVEKLNSQ